MIYVYNVFSPDCNGILFFAFFAKEKIEAKAGISYKKPELTFFQILTLVWLLCFIL